MEYDLLKQVGQVPKGGLASKQAFFTKKPGVLYAITPGWPGDKFVIRNVRVPADAPVTMLGVPGRLETSCEGTTLTVVLPKLNPDQAPCRYAYTLRISGGELLPEK